MAVRQLLRLWERALVRFAPLSFALFLASMSPAQVTGLVSSAASNQPIAGVTVHLCGRPPESSEKVIARCVATTTDEKGQFEFRVTPAGIYYVKAEAVGFLPDYASLDGDGSAEFTIGAEARFVPIWLMPEASISGRVLDENGRPMVGVAVSAIGQDFSLGARRLWLYQYRAEQSEFLTNEKGEFRVANLRPGKYYLQASLD